VKHDAEWLVHASDGDLHLLAGGIACLVADPARLLPLRAAGSDAMTAQTLGNQRVRRSFNPSGAGPVDELKDLAAQFIDLCAHLQNPNADDEEKRLWSLAMTHAEDAAMWAVKAATIDK
jgi:hypothetical protein